MSNLDVAVSLATKQHGVVSVFQLVELGILNSSIYRTMNNEMFTKISRGVFILKGAEPTWHQKAMIQVVSAGPRALLSHESALINLELLKPDFVSFRKNERIDFHVTLPRTSSRRLTSSLHRSIFQDDHFAQEVVNAIPQVKIEYAILESARHIPPQICGTVIDAAISKNLTNAKKIKHALSQIRVAPGRSKARVADCIRDYLIDPRRFALAESILENRMLRIVRRCTASKVILQYPVNIGSQKYRIDIALPEQKVAIEVDGFEFHRGREAFDKDKKRQNDIVAAGWTVLRFTATQSDEEIRFQLNQTLSRWAFNLPESGRLKAQRGITEGSEEKSKNIST